MTEDAALRVDKWLMYARFFKTRALAAKAVSAGVRINGERTDKTHAKLRPGDIVTFKQARRIRVIRVEAIAERRGPASEAATLYTDMEPKEGEAET